jgi:hypothetical protein
VDDDLAYLAPTLIPVPGAFQADGSNPMISHTAENIMFKVKKNMILGDLGKPASYIGFVSFFVIFLSMELLLFYFHPCAYAFKTLLNIRVCRLYPASNAPAVCAQHAD